MEEPVGRTNELLLSSVEKVGPLAPTGSGHQPQTSHGQAIPRAYRGVSTAWTLQGQGDYPSVANGITLQGFPATSSRLLAAARGLPYLMVGTGKLCAWHRSPKLWPVARSMERLLSSVENLGALAPTGSARGRRARG